MEFKPRQPCSQVCVRVHYMVLFMVRKMKRINKRFLVLFFYVLGGVILDRGLRTSLGIMQLRGEGGIGVEIDPDFVGLM